jgi:hypothetical protein
MNPLDYLLERASRIAERKNSGVTVGDEPLVVDLAPPIQTMHWIAYQIAARGEMTTRSIATNPGPQFGLYLVPYNAPVESLADGALNNTTGWNREARHIALPYLLNVQRAGAGGAFLFTCVAQLFSECVIPSGMMLRFIANCVPGTAAPGPGAGSFAALIAHVIEESNSPPTSPRHV